MFATVLRSIKRLAIPLVPLYVLISWILASICPLSSHRLKLISFPKWCLALLNSSATRPNVSGIREAAREYAGQVSVLICRRAEGHEDKVYLDWLYEDDGMEAFSVAYSTTELPWRGAIDLWVDGETCLIAMPGFAE